MQRHALFASLVLTGTLLAQQQEADAGFAALASYAPPDAAVVALLATPASGLLTTAVGFLPRDVLEAIDEKLSRTEDRRSLRERAVALGAAAEDRAMLVVSPKPEAADPDIPVQTPSAIPWIALAIPLRKTDGPSPALGLAEFLTNYHAVFGFERVFNLAMDPRGSVTCRELCHRSIPGTGELAILVTDELLILSNSGPLSRSMYVAHGKGGKSSPLDGSPLPAAGSASIYLRNEFLQPVLAAYVDGAGGEAGRESPVRALLDWTEGLGRARARIDLGVQELVGEIDKLLAR